MSEVMEVLDNKELLLTLEIVSKADHFNKEAVYPLWETMQLAKLTGDYRIVAHKKIVGVSAMKGIVKILGLSRTYGASVKSQSHAEDCYESTLTLKRSQENRGLYGSKLVCALKDVAGDGWFDPTKPESKIYHDHRAQKPLVQVANAIPDSPPPPATPEVSPPKKFVHKISGDMEQIKAIFEDMVRSAEGNVIYSSQVTGIIVSWVCDSRETPNLRMSGPILRAWQNRGWVNPCGEKTLKGRPYRIMPKAFEDFSLEYPGKAEPSLDWPKNPVAEKVSSPDTAKMESLTFLDQAKLAKDRVRELENIRCRITELEARKTDIEEKLTSLRRLSKDHDLLQAEKVWLQLSALTKETKNK